MKGTGVHEEVDLALRKKFDRLLPKQTIIAKVIEVDRAKLTCDVEPADGGAAYVDVRLQSTIDDSDQGVFLIPKVGSFVTISIVSNDDNYCYVAQYSEIDEFVYKIDELELSGNKDGVRINNKGENLKNVLNDWQSEFGKLCDEVNKIVVNIGTSPNVPVIIQIKAKVDTTIKQRLNKILK